jgi:hypothetical protein
MTQQNTHDSAPFAPVEGAELTSIEGGLVPTPENTGLPQTYFPVPPNLPDVWNPLPTWVVHHA